MRGTGVVRRGARGCKFPPRGGIAMRNGFKVFDADTHIQPSVETLTPYMDAATQARQPELERFLHEVKIGRAGQVFDPPFTHWYRFESRGGWGSGKPRHLGEAGPREKEERHFQNFQGRIYPSRYSEDGGIETRIAEMDQEGVDVELMVHGAFTGHEDLSVDAAMIGAVHRFLDDICSRYPDRLTSLISASARDVENAVSEIKTWGGSRWARGVMLELPLDYPIDHPDLHPVWAAADDAGLAVVHHSNSAGYPGYRDLWDNPFIGRTASHPWGAMRMTAAFLGAGLLDKYPNINLAILESGFGWLPFWMKRMEDQVHYMGYV
ncbi:MAG: amidohydrolase family protein, partial [Chloroflexi bacterium]|nr:amidohydrolase family protein [Chloroflexota bacterium]